MRMKLIALAVASIAAVPAFAQSNVTIYGRADGGFVSRSGSDGAIQTNGRKNEIASGIGAGSRFGFRGTEDLGGGLKAIFQYELGVPLDSASIATGGSGLSSRNYWVGLTSDSMGTAVLGRLDGVRYSIANQYDPFGGGYVGNMGSIQTHATRGDNAIAYISPSFGGFKVLAAYTPQLIGQEYGSAAAPGCAALLPAPVAGTAGAAQVVQNNQAVPVAPFYEANSCDIQLWAIKPTFDMGGLSLTLDYESFENKNVDSSDGSIWVVAGSYDFKFMKIAAYYEQVKTDRNGAAPATGNGYATSSFTGAPGGGNCAAFAGGFCPDQAMDQQSYMLGVTVPFGNFSFRGSWVGLKDDTVATTAATPGVAGSGAGRQRTGDCDKYSLGASYNLSKRTSLYMDYAWINQDSMSTCTISFSAATGGFDNGGVGPAAGYGVKGFDLGIAHTF